MGKSYVWFVESKYEDDLYLVRMVPQLFERIQSDKCVELSHETNEVAFFLVNKTERHVAEQAPAKIVLSATDDTDILEVYLEYITGDINEPQPKSELFKVERLFEISKGFMGVRPPFEYK